MTYQPNKLSRRLDEAYYLAANYTLERLGYFIKPITPQTLTPKHTLHYGSPSNFPAEYTISAPGHSMLTSSSPAEPIVRHTPKQPFPDSGLFISSPPPLAPIRSHCYGSSSSPADCIISAPDHSLVASSSPAESIVRHTPKQPFPDSGLFTATPCSHTFTLLWLVLQSG